MGRLFWKFFIVFWLAQLLTVVGVGTGMWLAHGNDLSAMRHAHPPPVAVGVKPVAPGPDGIPLPLRPPLMPLLAGSVVSLCFAGLLAWFFARPIRSLRSAFRALADGQLDVRIGDSLSRRRDEFTELGSDFDRMAEQLGSLIQGQRRLLHDVSHELRSPLARLQATADLMEQQPDRSSDLIARIHRDTTRMNDLVGELLALARLNAGASDNLTEEVEIDGIIAEVVDRTQFEAEQKHLRLETQVASSIILPANRELLHRALENVVRNAVRYSPDGGLISILARRDDALGQTAIEITDEGPGVPEDDLEAIFAPFTRAEESDWTSGYGLGLSITRRVAEALGGSVLACNQPKGGLRIVMRLPLHNSHVTESIAHRK